MSGANQGQADLMAAASEGQTSPAAGWTLRERRRQRQASAIELIALKLFASQGFSAVTIDQIAAAADISTRTFFRYFANKEDVLFGDRRRFEDTLALALEGHAPGESAVDALRAGLIALSREVEADVASTQLRLQLLEQSPQTMAAAFERRRTYQRRLVPLVASRMQLDEAKDMRPALIVDLLLSATYVALWHWLATGAKAPLHRLVAEALDLASAGLS
jgi:AcrR family transcriptional regulator